MASPIERDSKRKRKRKTRANILIGSLNIRGGGSDLTMPKWQQMCQFMKRKKLGLIATQETHLTRSQTERLNTQFERKLIIINSIDHLTPNSKGVAIVINRDIVRCKPRDIEAKEIIAGRALLVAIPWKNFTQKLYFLAVYAPNDPLENRNFWHSLSSAFQNGNRGYPKPHFVLGDFNLVEEGIDRMPPHVDNEHSVKALQALKQQLHLTDGWRRTYPSDIGYTWSQQAVRHPSQTGQPETTEDPTDQDTGLERDEPDSPHNSQQPTPSHSERDTPPRVQTTLTQATSPVSLPEDIQQDRLSKSRIDRIYINMQHFNRTSEWEIRHDHPLKTDHELVTVRYTDTRAPYVGRGRWEIPTYMTDDKEFMDFVKKEGNLALAKIEALAPDDRSAKGNPQAIYEHWKNTVRGVAKEIAKGSGPRLQKLIDVKHDELDMVLNDTFLSIEVKSAKASKLSEEIKDLESKQHEKMRMNTQVKYLLETENIGKAWVRANKEKKPRDTIPMLKSESGEEIRRSDKMAEAAKNYHEKLQSQGLPEEDNRDARENAIREVLGSLDKQLNVEDKLSLDQTMTRAEIEKALSSTPSGKASGPDGIPTELWKNLATDYAAVSNEDTGEQKEESFDVLDLLTRVFNDIELHGIVKEGNFAKGWMCPLFKKKEKDNIANYRPITVLNVDYKMFTKVLTIRISPIALKLIHENQAGFMKGRRIDDHTETIKLMINWCEEVAENGMLVFLDQEKAYDKITHDFLQRTLTTFEFPEHFRKTIQGLYENAHTVVIINGEISEPYRVTRGVRQGDPLSCLLFNLAIESLACMIRKSTLEGFTIQDNLERLITTLFADDTTVYLSEGDDFRTLQEILDKWCLASGAKFNVAKTEIIPIGTKTYRDRFRRNQPDGLPPGAKIAHEGEPVRALGAFVGNGIDNLSVWTPTLETTESKTEYWIKSNPSQEGRVHITKMEPGGRTQYRSMVQGMPDNVEKRIGKLIRKIMWNGKPSGVNHETSRLLYEHGGKKVLDIVLRNKAISLMRLMRYLDDPPTRPIWAYLADNLIARDIPKVYAIRDPDVTINIFKQSWRTMKQRGKSKLPLSIQNMIRTGHELGMTYCPPVLTECTCNEHPLWFNPNRDPNNRVRIPDSGVRAECLQRIHGIYTVEHLLNFVQHNPFHPEAPRSPAQRRNEDKEDCTCERCECARAMECADPEMCRYRAKLILDAIPPKWNPTTPKLNDDVEREKKGQREADLKLEKHEHLFHHNLEHYAKTSNGFRFLVPEPQRMTHEQPHLPTTNPDMDQPCREFFIETKGQNIGDTNAKVSFGISSTTNDPQTIAGVLPTRKTQDSPTALAYGLQTIVKEYGKKDNMKVHLPDKNLVNALTIDLIAHERENWMSFGDPETFRKLTANLRTRTGLTILAEHAEHTDQNARAKARAAAATALSENTRRPPLPNPSPKDIVSGYQLAGMTQAKLYRILLNHERSNITPRNNTQANLNSIRRSAMRRLNRKPNTRPGLQCWTR